ncbi:hypothetical protein DDU33_05690 [Actinobacillus porcitonsillarum]|uniref:Uncharacterized protein n=1 Tax=Actinobacillus porcitonsillarum TaxID=189834 RepID=A0A2U8FJ63_9PAST|nr:hypothetical protein DDU33_05690 [Actinobacillus porcitonsillarum]
MQKKREIQPLANVCFFQKNRYTIALVQTQELEMNLHTLTPYTFSQLHFNLRGVALFLFISIVIF